MGNPSLRVLLFKETGLRDRFIMACLKNAPPSAKARFNNWHGKRFDWRWENLEHLLGQLLDTFADFQRVFDPTLMPQHTTEGQFFLELASFVRHPPPELGQWQGAVSFDMLLTMFQIVYMVYQAVGSQVGWLEMRPCHQATMRRCESYTERLAAMRRCGCAFGRCAWQGKAGDRYGHGAPAQHGATD